MEIVTRLISELKAYENNSRTHPEAQIAQIAASIKEFGFTNPVLIDEGNGVIAGHGRLLAAKLLGHTEVPCIVLAGLSDVQKRAYVIADNKLALNAGWDEDLLRLELDELNADEFNLLLTGFSESEISGLLGDGARPLGSMPELPTGERSNFRQITFTLHVDQADTVDRALSTSKGLGVFDNDKNDNSNGNALARICEMWVYGQG